jgi:hypothetical protein
MSWGWSEIAECYFSASQNEIDSLSIPHPLIEKLTQQVIFYHSIFQLCTYVHMCVEEYINV